MPIERLADRSGVASSQLYVLVHARVSASIDQLVPLSAALAVPAHLLLALDERDAAR